MTSSKPCLGILCCLFSLWASDDPAQARIRSAASKAIAVIQNSQNTWFSKQSCFSCHQQVLPALAFRAAREHGIPVDEQRAHADAAAAFGFYSNLDQAVQFTHVIDPANNDAWAMLAASAAGVRPNLVTAVYARLLAARQEPDGHWETGDDRPPQSYSPVTATAISIAAIEEFGHDKLKADTQARAVRARAWLLAQAPRNTEERAFQLFGVSVTGADQTVTTRLARQLAAAQQPDGGWASRDGLPSDAYSTGEALWALHNAGGVPTSDPAFHRGIDFLLRTQAADGSWHVHSRIRPPAPVSPPYFETGHPYGHDQFISTMGESWAIIALAEMLPRVSYRHPSLPEAEPAGVEPWMETVLFGSVADMDRLLKTGFDPNSATQAGGTTALMMAAPDVAKMRLLLDHGANADARAKNRYSALLVTANYPGAGAAINLLLDRALFRVCPRDKGRLSSTRTPSRSLPSPAMPMSSTASTKQAIASTTV